MFFLISTSLFVGQIPLKLSVITVRKRSCRKVMFLHLFVSYSVHSGCVSQHALGQTPPLEQTSPCRHPRLDRHPPRQTPPSGQTSPPADTSLGRHPPCSVYAGIQPPPPVGHCCGRYASYWNAFLFTVVFHQFFMWPNKIDLPTSQ